MRKLQNFGIGVDIVDIDRFNELKSKNLFLDKVFTKSEKEYCLSKNNPEAHLAARFSGKEAVLKALYSVGIKEVDYRKIEILMDENGVPIVNLKDNIVDNIQIKVSLSHSRDESIAFAFVAVWDQP